MNHRNTLHTTCPCCGVSFELTTDNIRQADFRRKYKKYDYVTKSSIDAALDADDSIADDQDEDLETEL